MPIRGTLLNVHAPSSARTRQSINGADNGDSTTVCIRAVCCPRVGSGGGSLPVVGGGVEGAGVDDAEGVGAEPELLPPPPPQPIKLIKTRDKTK